MLSRKQASGSVDVSNNTQICEKMVTVLALLPFFVISKTQVTTPVRAPISSALSNNTGIRPVHGSLSNNTGIRPVHGS